MDPFITLNSIPAPLPMINVDTDMIIPKQFLKTIKRSGLGKNLFHELRYDIQGNIKNDFVLNWDPYKSSKILIAGANFGCGSSREHAPWSLLDFGFKSIIAPSFADIFYNNCFKNGILPIKLDQIKVDLLMKDAENKNEITVDLENQIITYQKNNNINFEILLPDLISCFSRSISISSFLLEYSDNSKTFCSSSFIGKIPFLKQLL